MKSMWRWIVMLSWFKEVKLHMFCFQCVTVLMGLFCCRSWSSAGTVNWCQRTNVQPLKTHNFQLMSLICKSNRREKKGCSQRHIIWSSYDWYFYNSNASNISVKTMSQYERCWLLWWTFREVSPESAAPLNFIHFQWVSLFLAFQPTSLLFYFTFNALVG